jgi:hypothetical protein
MLLSSTGENNFDLESVSCSSYHHINLAEKPYRSCNKYMYKSVLLPLSLPTGQLKSNLWTAITRHNVAENNIIISWHAQDTSALQPYIYL